MRDLLDLDRYPIDRGDAAVELAERCRRDLAATGMFNLEGFVRPDAIRRAVQEIVPLTSGAGFTRQCEELPRNPPHAIVGVHSHPPSRAVAS